MIDKLSINYKDAGVDIDNSNSLINFITNITKKTNRSEVISTIGSFNALCEFPKKYTEPVIVTTTDGVGTKLLLATDTKCFYNIGLDLVAMCVNDLIVCGAEPLFFLDYYSTGKLDVKIASSIMQGIVDACYVSGCALIGGETAEVPGIYVDKYYDLVGFCIGIVEKSKIINGNEINDGDVLIAIGSSGPHANGYSLIRKILKIHNINPLIEKLNGKPLLHYLIEPTRIYVNNILKLTDQVNIKAMIHLTGGSFLENIPRMIPNNTQAVINETSWVWPPIFNWIQKKSNISRQEMYRTFNCGVGMIIMVNKLELKKTISFLNDVNEKAWPIGVIKITDSKERVLFIK
ncbi:phosphoribosylformylglycinamidine cyclo-ligase [Candidatus Pantoea edessiphila]|uniref:Phosphoribosylformylglycinamidine cyclo-ligase n=1 Tax=Candidatus Pantoea edessiphila TaxID=2044610 RepID=A0A2P5T2W3_9GAMM|nr:phosphoribosylformylglycinamidine cyclo-ligase [Candidatus Pantoea edessiphila]PPI88917.1 phosphoribosylformylglycinamidine cyclo-ligase [Candidatus Pantoea edessiphila]